MPYLRVYLALARADRQRRLQVDVGAFTADHDDDKLGAKPVLPIRQ